MRTHTKTLIAAALTASFSIAISAIVETAHAAPGVIKIPIDTVVRSDEGVQTVLADVAVPSDLVGRTCTATYLDLNNTSRHPGNDLVLSTGDVSVTFAGVEDEPGQSTQASGNIVLGPSITVTLIMGPDTIFSADAELVVDCPDPPATSTTTTTTTTTTTEAPAPSTSTTTTTVPTEAGGIQESNPAQPVTAQPSFTG